MQQTLAIASGTRESRKVSRRQESVHSGAALNALRFIALLSLQFACPATDLLPICAA